MLWRAVAPGPPGTGDRRFHALRASGADRSATVVWCLVPERVRAVHGDGEQTVVELATGARHTHRRAPHGWRVDTESGGTRESLELGGLAPTGGAAAAGVAPAMGAAHVERVNGSRSPADPSAPGAPVHFGLEPVLLPARLELGEAHWRATEESWAEAGAPHATVEIGADAEWLAVRVRVDDPEPQFTPWREENELDNEPADVNSDGVQLHLCVPEAGLSMASWLLVPDEDGTVRFTVGGDTARAPALEADWRRDVSGWEIRARWPREGALAGTRFRLDVLVNEISAERERRRGQLVMSGARGERAYLVGDRQSPDHYLPFAIPSA